MKYRFLHIPDNQLTENSSDLAQGISEQQKPLDPLETTLAKIARIYNKCLFEYRDKEYLLTLEKPVNVQVPLDQQDVLTSYYHFDMVLRFDKDKKNPNILKLQIYKDNLNSTFKDVDLEKFIYKSNHAINKLKEHEEIIQELIQINPETEFTKKNNLGRVENFEKESERLKSDVLLGERTIFSVLTSNNRDLTDEKETFSFAHIEGELTKDQFKEELQRLKQTKEKVNELIDLCKIKYGEDISVEKKLNELNPLIPNFDIKKDGKSILFIENEMVKLPNQESKKSLDSTIEDIKIQPSVSLRSPSTEMLRGSSLSSPAK